MSDLERELVEIDDKVIELLIRRGEIAYELGINDRFFVFDNEIGDKTDEYWLLDPVHDLEVLKLIRDIEKREDLKEQLINWIEEIEASNLVDYSVMEDVE